MGWRFLDHPSTCLHLWADPDAFAELFDACARAVYNHAFRLTADWSLAEDVMSTTFMEEWRRRASVEAEGGSLRPWLLGIASKVASTYPRTVGDKTTVVSQRLHSRQVWNSLDGRDGWLIEDGQTSDKGITLNGDIPFSGAYNALAALPTDPDALLQRIYRESDAVRDPEVPRDQAAFVAIGDLLFESCPPAEVGAALYKAAAKIPGVVSVDDAVDATGRHGVAIAREDSGNGERIEWIFDKKTLRFLGERTVVLKAVAHSPFKVGTVTFTSAITQRAIVDASKQVPGQAS